MNLKCDVHLMTAVCASGTSASTASPSMANVFGGGKRTQLAKLEREFGKVKPKASEGKSQPTPNPGSRVKPDGSKAKHLGTGTASGFSGKSKPTPVTRDPVA